MKKTYAGLLFFVVFQTSAFPASGQSPTTTTGDSENGRRLFTADGCYECHGRQGQGGGAGPRLGPPRMPPAALKMYVRHPNGAMPPYTAKVISDSELDDIYAFLKTIRAPLPVKEIPLLNQ